MAASHPLASARDDGPPPIRDHSPACRVPSAGSTLSLLIKEREHEAWRSLPPFLFLFSRWYRAIRGPRDRQTEVSNAGEATARRQFLLPSDALLSLRYRSRPVLERYLREQPRGENSPRRSSRLFSSISRECTLSVHSLGTVAVPVYRQYAESTIGIPGTGISQKVYTHLWTDIQVSKYFTDTHVNE